jgi:hypothetical protein
MSEDHIRYEALVLDALRGVVRSVFQRVQKRGVPGDHHFFVTFDTQAEGVSISKRLKDQYANEMTIVLQHQFWDLAVHDDRFEVRLSFSNIPERLVIPFSAIRIFQDPSVQFALALRGPDGVDQTPSASGAPDLQLLPAPTAANPAGKILGLPKPASAPSQDAQKPEAVPNPPSQSVKAAKPERHTAEVVSLDKFRKK